MTLSSTLQLVVVMACSVAAARFLASRRPVMAETRATNAVVLRTTDLIAASGVLIVLVFPIPFLLGSRPGGIAIAAAELLLVIEPMHRRVWRRRHIDT